MTLGDAPISWKTKKKSTMSRSSAETEYRGTASTASELILLRTLLRDFTVESQSMQLFCDNQAAMHIASNPIYHERIKHVKIDCHFV